MRISDCGLNKETIEWVNGVQGPKLKAQGPKPKVNYWITKGLSKNFIPSLTPFLSQFPQMIVGENVGWFVTYIQFLKAC